MQHKRHLRHSWKSFLTQSLANIFHHFIPLSSFRLCLYSVASYSTVSSADDILAFNLFKASSPLSHHNHQHLVCSLTQHFSHISTVKHRFGSSCRIIHFSSSSSSSFFQVKQSEMKWEEINDVFYHKHHLESLNPLPLLFFPLGFYWSRP